MEITSITLEATQVLGTAATLYGVGGALSVLLQARQMHARGSSGDVSARFLTVYVGGFAIWLLYGLSIGDVPIILVHAVGLLCGTITLAVALRLRGSLHRLPDGPEKLSEKGFEQHSERGFGQYKEDEMGRKVPSQRSVGLRYR